ncbi:hypothetical protein QF001_000918 [Paraburkholderia youngii]|uniref:hypothetical protein n=1 Tax=Paraburkholderia youngii TaxID=2782701 RepID=UPI003D22DFC6
MAREKKPAPDWERIEADYRAGLLSVREIAAAHGISHTYINTRAKKFGWVRDLSKRIQDKAEALVSTATVSKEVSTETALSDKAIVDANAQVIANVRLAHRTDISKSRSLVMTLLDELSHQTEHRELYENLGVLMMAPDDNGRDKLYEAYMKAMSLGGRTSTMKALSDSLKTLIALEREAYGVVEEPPPPPAPPVQQTTVVIEDAVAAARRKLSTEY